MNASSSSHSSSDGLSEILAGSPITVGAAALVLATAFCWGLYIETARRIDDNPLIAYHLRNELGFLMCSMAALCFIFLAGAVLYKGFMKSDWSLLEIRVFWFSITLDAIYLITGFQYILFGEWKYPFVGLFLTVKGILIVTLALQLYRVIKLEWFRQKRQEEESSS